MVAVVAFNASPLRRRVVSSLPHPGRVHVLVAPVYCCCVTSFVAFLSSSSSVPQSVSDPRVIRVALSFPPLPSPPPPREPRSVPAGVFLPQHGPYTLHMPPQHLVSAGAGP